MQRPRMKSVFPPIPTGDGRIRIGGGDFGIASEITDDGGNVWHLMSLMDGTRTRPELAGMMREWSAGITRADVDAVVDTLVDMGFVEDAAAALPDELSQPEIERYRRNLEFFSYFHQPPLTAADFQVRLRDANVTVLGLGGLGSYVALSLAAIGVGQLTVVDFDKVELINLNRQFPYTDGDIGRPKAEAAAERLAAANPHVRITPVTAAVDGVQAARTYLAGRDLLICAADRPRLTLYHWINEAALAERVPWIRGGNDGLSVSLCLHVPFETACFRCAEQEAEAEFPEYGPMTRYLSEVIGDRSINPCTAPMAGMIGSLTALESVKFLTGVAEPVIRGQRLVIDVLRMETSVGGGRRLDSCDACGNGATR